MDYNKKMKPYDFVVMLLATYRITSFLVIDFGPYDKMQQLREFFIARSDYFADTFVGKTINTISDLLQCVFCTSVWVSLILTTVYFTMRSTLSHLFILSFAIAGAVQLVYNLVHNEESDDDNNFSSNGHVQSVELPQEDDLNR